MQHTTFTSQAPAPQFFNKTTYDFDCGMLDTCNYYGTKEECDKNAGGLSCYENVATTLVEYVKTFTPYSETSCYTQPNLLVAFDHRSPLAYTQRCVTTPRIAEDTRETGKTFEGPKVFATKSRFFSTEDNAYLLPALLVIGSLALIFSLAQSSAKRLKSVAQFDK